MFKNGRLSARLVDAEKAVQASLANWAARLAHADDAEMENLIGAVAKAEADAVSLRSALTEIDRLIDDAGEKKAAALKGERRETEGAAMLETAATVDKLTPKFEAAVAELSKVVKHFAESTRGGVALWPSWDRFDRTKRYGAATTPDLVSALLAEAVYGIFPDAFTWDFWRASLPLRDFICSKHAGSPVLQRLTQARPALTTEKAVKFVSDRLRTIAAEIRASGVAAKVRTESTPVSLVADPEIEVLVLKAFK